MTECHIICSCGAGASRGWRQYPTIWWAT